MEVTRDMISSSDDSRGLEVRDVFHAFGSTSVLSGVSLVVKPGQVHCLLGPSGSGKTTLLRLVAGLERLQRGEIAVLDEVVASPARQAAPEHRPVGLVFQDFALFPHLSVLDNILFGIPRDRADRRERARDLLERVDLREFEAAMPHTLSGGQQQRVALARALAGDPHVMLLDEPFSGLDAALRDEVRAATLDVLRSSGVATLMVTHSAHEAMMIADEISVILDGRIEQTESPRELYLKPASVSVASMLGEANLVHGIVRQGSLETPWGSLEAPGIPEGQPATALLRPEALSWSREPGPGTVPATVVSSRFLAGYLRVKARLADGQVLSLRDEISQEPGDGEEIHLGVPGGASSWHVVPAGGASAASAD